MPPAPLPEHLAAFLARPNAAVVASVRADGSPVTSATWYLFDGEHVLLSMDAVGERAQRLRAAGTFALTALAEDWYSHLSVTGRVVEVRDDPDLVELDRIAVHYTGEPYEERGITTATVVAVVERWHTFGKLR